MRKFIGCLVVVLGACSLFAQSGLPALGSTWSGAAGGAAVITLIQSNGSALSGVTALPVTIGSSVAAGDLILVNGMFGSVTGTFAVTDNATGCSNTYTAVTGSPLSDGGGSPNDSYAFWAKNCGIQAGGLTVTVTVTGGGSHSQRGAVFEYHSTTGWPTTPVDQANATATSSAVSTGSAGNITPTVTNTLVSSVWEINGTATTASITVASPCTIREAGGTSGNGYGSVSKVDGADDLSATTSPVTCTFSWTTAAGYGAIISNYKPN